MNTELNSPIKSLELATEANFHPNLYAVVNPDLLAEVKRNQSFDLYTHFRQFGIHERRMQLSPKLFFLMKEKFSLFEGILASQGYHHTAVDGAFPISTSSHVFDLTSYEGESANPSPWFWVDEIAANPRNLYLDLGAGFREEVYLNCVNLEVYPSLTADIIIAPNSPLPFKDESLDGVGCFSVLEHTSDPFTLAAEIKRVIKPGGRLFIDWPFLQPFHGYPSHYFNATAVGLCQTFSDTFEIETLEAMEWQRVDSTLSWILSSFVDGIKNEKAKDDFLCLTVRELLEKKPKSNFYRTLLETVDDDTKKKLACGNTLIGRKKNSA